MMHTFSKSERFCGQKRIRQLYQTGAHFVVWPLRITYHRTDDGKSEVLLWASKSLFKHAVDRNRIRRQMRECYRLQKHIVSDKGIGYLLAINYISKEKESFAEIYRSMQRALLRLSEESKGGL